MIFPAFIEENSKMSFLAPIFNFSSSTNHDKRSVRKELIMENCMCAVTSQHGGWYSFYGRTWEDNSQNGACSILKHDHSFWQSPSIL